MVPMRTFMKIARKVTTMRTEQIAPVRVAYSDSDLYLRNWVVQKKSNLRKDSLAVWQQDEFFIANTDKNIIGLVK